MQNNLWWNFAAGNTISGIAPQDFVQAHLLANNNQIVDPRMRSISRDNSGMLDPRPAAGSPALNTSFTAPNDGFFTPVNYMGAFDSETNWAKGWSFLSAAKVLDVKVDFKRGVPTALELTQNYPNPFNPSTTIRFTLPAASHVRLVVYNMYGQKVDELVNEYHEAGGYSIQWSAGSLPSGTYLYSLQTADGMKMKSMSLVK
jgi:hypothetical protein